MVQGRIKSCGCLHKESTRKTQAETQTIHGYAKSHSKTHSRPSIYTAWSNMRKRCNSPTHRAFKNYGARGITVCERWQDFKNFLTDMGERPSDKYELDRIDPNGNYEPSNCRWYPAGKGAMRKSKHKTKAG
jgi:hypothetical protein